ncbi:MAG: YqgE/AlgH family protein [bacterium]
MTASSPILLIAVPQLGDPNFFHGVVLLMQHDSEGAFGWVINRPTSLTLGEFAQSQGIPCHGNLAARPVFQGGPVELERGWVLHRDLRLGESQELLPGLFVSGGMETLKKLLSGQEDAFRFVLGYAGWGPGQLEAEMQEGAWITVAADPRYVFEVPPDQTWSRTLQDLGIDPASLMLGKGLH